MTPSVNKVSPPEITYEYHNSLDWVFNQILHEAAKPPNWVNIEVIRNLKSQLKTLHINSDSPSTKLKLINTGYFKECYESGLNDWVIKFCSTENDTIKEKQIYSAAQEAGIGDLFPQTEYITLPHNLPAIKLDTEGISEITSTTVYHSEYKELNTLVIQRKITTLSALDTISKYDICQDDADAEDYNCQPLIAGDYFLSDELFDKIDAPYRWLKEVLAYYGNEIFQAFCEFCEDYNIQDLHSGNIGYIVNDDQKIPVIIDWLSF